MSKARTQSGNYYIGITSDYFSFLIKWQQLTVWGLSAGRHHGTMYFMWHDIWMEGELDD